MNSFISLWKNSWKDSLSVLRPEQRTLFMLVTLKTIVTTYKQLAISFWWLFLLYGATFYLFFATMSWIPMILGIIIVSLMFLAVRPSVERKTFLYFLSYLGHDYLQIFFLLLTPYLIFSRVAAQWYTLFFVFFIFFILDSGLLWGWKGDGILKTVYRTGIMLFCNAPILFMAHGIFLLFFIVLTHYLHVPVFYLIFLVPVPLSFFNNIYVKQVHEQFNLYA